MERSYVYDAANHSANTFCPQKWFWCRIHWWVRFSDQGKWYEPYPLTVNRKDADGVWSNTEVHCGPGTFYPKPISNRSYAK